MKPTHHNDPLDQKIDALLASRPLKPSDDFAARVLAATEADVSATKRPMAKIIAFALPLAAAVAIALSLLQSDPTAPANATALSNADAQEIFLLEESLSGLATLDTGELSTTDLLSTLDALYLEI